MVTILPALKTEFGTVTPPVVIDIVLPASAATRTYDDVCELIVEPVALNVTAAEPLKVDVAVSPVPAVKAFGNVSDDQVLSPRKYVEELGVPVAEKDEIEILPCCGTIAVKLVLK
jgi:hypothetical protein